MSDKTRAPCVAQLRAWAADPLQTQCWGLAELADEIERLRGNVPYAVDLADAARRENRVVDELLTAIENREADIGGSRPTAEIIGDLGPAYDALKEALAKNPSPGSSAVEQRFRKPQVEGSTPSPGTNHREALTVALPACPVCDKGVLVPIQSARCTGCEMEFVSPEQARANDAAWCAE